MEMPNIVISDWIGLVGALIALASLVIAAWSLKARANDSRSHLYLELRDRFMKIYPELPRNQPKWYHNEEWTPKANIPEDKFSTMEKYWYQVFDEWYITRKIRGSTWGLWPDFYKKAIFEGLKYRPLRCVLFYMKEEIKVTFAGQGKDFFEDLDRIYKRYRKLPNYTNLPENMFEGMRIEMMKDC